LLFHRRFGGILAAWMPTLTPPLHQCLGMRDGQRVERGERVDGGTHGRCPTTIFKIYETMGLRHRDDVPAGEEGRRGTRGIIVMDMARPGPGTHRQPECRQSGKHTHTRVQDTTTKTASTVNMYITLVYGLDEGTKTALMTRAVMPDVRCGLLA